MTKPRRIQVAQSGPLLAFLLSALGLKRAAAKKLLKFGAVQVGGVPARRFDHELRPGDEVAITDLRSMAAEARFKEAHVRIVYEDEALIAVDKPEGLLTVATDREQLDTLFVQLNDYLRSRRDQVVGRIFVVHRLDKDTSGLVLFAKSEKIKEALQAQWNGVEKTYFAIVRGRPATEQGTIDNYLVEDSQSLKVSRCEASRPDAQHAVTHYRLLESVGARSLLEVKLETGRKHQIRVHLTGIGCPVVGDKRYGRKGSTTRMALHAAMLRLVHPVSGEQLVIKSPMPRAMRKMMLPR